MFRQIAPAIYSLMLLLLANGFFMTYLTLRMNSDNVSEIITGSMHSIFYLGMLISALRTESLISRIGHMRAYSAFASISVVSMVCHGLYLNPFAWVFFRFFAGVALGGLYVAIESWLLAKSQISTRGRILAIYMVSLYFAQATGQWVVKLIQLESFDGFLIAAGITCLSIIPVTTTKQPSPEIQDARKIKLFQYFRISPLGVTACLMSGIILSIIYSFLPNFAQDFEISVPGIMSLTILGGALLQWPIGKASDIFDRRKVLILLCFIILPLCIAVLYFPSNNLLVLCCAFFIGGATFTLYPVGISITCDQIDKECILEATCVLLVVYSFGCILGPLMSSFFIRYISSLTVFSCISFTAFLLGLFTLYFLVRKPMMKPPLPDNFVPLPSPTPVAHEMDPRIE